MSSNPTTASSPGQVVAGRGQPVGSGRSRCGRCPARSRWPACRPGSGRVGHHLAAGLVVVAGVEQQVGRRGEAVRAHRLAVALQCARRTSKWARWPANAIRSWPCPIRCETASRIPLRLSASTAEQPCSRASSAHEDHRHAGLAGGDRVLQVDRAGQHDQAGQVPPGHRPAEVRDARSVGAVRARVERLQRHDPIAAGHRGGVDAGDDRRRSSRRPRRATGCRRYGRSLRHDPPDSGARRHKRIIAGRPAPPRRSSRFGHLGRL